MSKTKTKGWICPACSGGVAPHVERCPCVALTPEKKPGAHQPPAPPPLGLDPWGPPPWGDYEITCRNGIVPTSPNDGIIYGPGPNIIDPHMIIGPGPSVGLTTAAGSCDPRVRTVLDDGVPVTLTLQGEAVWADA